jgi:flagellar biosynthesis/type III secretory pathway chaperone
MTAALNAALSRSGSDDSLASEATMQFRRDLDKRLEQLVLEEEAIARARPAGTLPIEIEEQLSGDPFEFVCAWGFTGKFNAPEAPPTTKTGFLTALKTEIRGIGTIQTAMQAYQRAINSREFHTFSVEFLIHQNTAVVVTLDQLDQITHHLKRVEKAVTATEGEDGEVDEGLYEAFQQVQPWISRARAIIRHSHVFYKINYVLVRPH